MLFSSYEFVLAFLPVVLVGYELLRRYSFRGSLVFLTLASLFFYGYWKAAYLVVLAVSIGTNFVLGRAIALRRGTKAARRILILGLTLNLAGLGYYKYSGLFARTFGALAGTPVTFEDVALPLAISFFTFQQIAYLVDIHRGKPDEPDPLKYLFFVVFFPHLIAGPIVHHRELLPQLANNPKRHQVARNLALGFSVFSFGLFKKVVLADSIAIYADRIFNGLGNDPVIGASTAWFGTVSFALQLYFDFSGYSDMAIGLAMLFGLRWPLNFNSPYKASSIKDFWRRWHMTLSRFLRDYLYIPLGGNRQGAVRQTANLMLTMLIGGLWHGAAWKFMLWGGLHGGYLVVQRVWERFGLRRTLATGPSRAGYELFSRAITLVAVLAAWVPFRASNMGTAASMWKGMAGLNGLGALPKFVGTPALLLLLGLSIVALFLPNTQQVFFRYRIASETYVGEIERPRAILRWGFRPDYRWGLVIVGLWASAFIAMSGVSPFIYYQF
jgi:alginate O-acetyltransferase complex protein AlgI